MARKLICYNLLCENNTQCGIADAEIGVCDLDEVMVGKSGFCLQITNVDKDTLDRLESESETLEDQNEE